MYKNRVKSLSKSRNLILQLNKYMDGKCYIWAKKSLNISNLINQEALKLGDITQFTKKPKNITLKCQLECLTVVPSLIGILGDFSNKL